MRPHLVRLNSTITGDATFIFNALLLVEIFLCCVILIGSPLFCVAVSRVGAIHRNFRCQMCLASLIYSLGIFARFVLIYYQVYDIPLTDEDPILLAADLVRDVVIGYYCGLSAAFCLQTLIATYFWKWYEQNYCSTLLVIVLSETLNITLSFMNAATWLLNYTPFAFNIVCLAVALTCSVSGFFYTYTKNARQLEKLSKSKISHASYTVGRSYQIRENILLMKANSVRKNGCFPDQLHLQFGIYSSFRVCYLYREITKHPLILREFRNLSIIQVWRRRAIHNEEASSVIPKIEITYTQTYFDQFKEAWR